MQTVGERLRAAREEQGLTLDEVAETTRIPVRQLAAIEEENFEVFTSQVHLRGFLRNYALALGLDPDQVANDAAKQRGDSHARRRARLSLEGSTVARRPRIWAMDALLVLVLVAIASLAGFSVYQQRLDREAAPTPGPPATPTVTPMPVFEGTVYTLDVDLRYAEHKLNVLERIDYTNVTSDTLPNLLLNVHPNCSRGTFRLNDIKVDLDGELVQPEVFSLDVWLRVELPRPLLPGQQATLLLDFGLDLPRIDEGSEFSGASFGYSRRSVSLGNWYPVLAPYRQDKGWYGLTCFQYGDPYVTEVADYHVTITTTEEVIIAGTGQEAKAGNQWRYEVERARSFAFAASDRYQASTAVVDGLTVSSYYFPDDREAGEVALETAVQAMQLFTELYGPYPYADYRVAETEFAGGLEFSGLTFLGSAIYGEYDGTSRTPIIPLAAHEVSHQWFYGLVGNDQVTEPWLDEAFAEYSALLYYERYLPADTDWWWFYAVDQWAPAGVIDARIHEFRSNRDYFDAVYRRGAQFVRDLRAAMTDPAFFALLQEYQRRYAYQLATSQDFFRLVQEFTTADLVPLQEAYFRQRILP